MENDSAIKKNVSFSDIMSGPREYYAKRNKLDKESPIMYDFIYMLNLKLKQKWIHRGRERTGSYQRGESQEWWMK